MKKDKKLVIMDFIKESTLKEFFKEVHEEIYSKK